VRLERIYNKAEYFTPTPPRRPLLQRLRKAIYLRAVSLWQHPDAQHRRAHLIQRFAPPEGPVRFLEIGCGTGRLLDVLRSLHPGWNLTGVEPSGFAAQECREAGFRVLTGTVEEVDLSGERFHLICAWNVLEHVDDPQQFLEWTVTHLETGGHLLLHTPNYGGLMRRLWGSSWFEFKPEYHLYYFNYPSLTRLAETVGLRRVHPETVCPVHNVGNQIKFVGRKLEVNPDH
jgi:2-polyprenyl-3-methyl-5-hydroxy-6-metoxy-1,4-benzoquinol methylase